MRELEIVLDKNARKTMLSWNIDLFKKTHPRLFKTIICSMEEIKNKNNTKNMKHNFKTGDKVVMHSCGEAKFEKNKGKVWICRTDSFLDNAKQEVVFLEGYSGYFLCDFLAIIIN